MEWPVMKLCSSAWPAARKSGTEAADGGLVESSGRIAVEGDNAMTDCRSLGRKRCQWARKAADDGLVESSVWGGKREKESCR